jgi:segregation and condensation protein B
VERLMEPLAALEAILFVTEAPVPLSELSEVLESTPEEVEALLERLRRDLDDRGSGLVVRSAGGGWRLYSRPDAYPYLERFASSATARRLSSAALEVLAVVAYKQPVSRGQLTEIRGVDSDSSLRTLMRLGLIEEAGRLSLPGNPAVYRTTDLFLEKLGISSLAELPPLADHVPPAEVVGALEETFRPLGSDT